jgi:hypothetical protein
MTTAAAKRWYQAVAELETCSLCRAYGVQVAHRNQGRGLGQKSAFHLTAAICPLEHYAIDNFFGYMGACALFGAGYMLGALLHNPDRWP